jgi:hypothetical protein
MQALFHRSLRMALSLGLTSPTALGGDVSGVIESSGSAPGTGLVLVQSDEVVATPTNETRVSFVPYLWALGFDGNAAIGPVSSDVSISFLDILDGTEDIVAGFGALSIDGDRVGYYLSGAYASADLAKDVNRADIRIELDVTWFEAGFSAEIASSGAPIVGRERREDAWRLWLTAGVLATRLSLDGDVGIGAIRQSATAVEQWVDPMIGLRFGSRLSTRSNLLVSGRAGGFGVGSDFAWIASAGLSIDLSDHDPHWLLFLGYRAIGQDYSTVSGGLEFEWDVVSHGPMIGLSAIF